MYVCMYSGACMQCVLRYIYTYICVYILDRTFACMCVIYIVTATVIQVFMMILRLTVALLLIAQYSRSIPLDQFYPFGANEGDQELSSNTGILRFIFLSNRFSFYNISRFQYHVSLTM